jgi:glutamine amidotransferase
MKTTFIEIVNLNVSNIGSVLSAFSEMESVEVKVIQSFSESKRPHLLVLPGNGSFKPATQRLNSSGIRDLALSRHSQEAPILGICLGMQLLGDASEEAPGILGLGLVPGSSRVLPRSGIVPHVGWETVNWKDDAKISNLDDTDFYFMHSFAFCPTQDSSELAHSNVGTERITSAVLEQKTLGLQFHPEKSSKAGQALLRQILIWANE